MTEVHDNLIVVSINRTYHEYGDDPMALYESTRGVWKNIASERADAADYIAGVVDGRIVYVMTASAWLPAGSTNYFVREQRETNDRIEFVGRTADDAVQDLYLGRELPAHQRQVDPGVVADHRGHGIVLGDGDEGLLSPLDFPMPQQENRMP